MTMTPDPCFDTIHHEYYSRVRRFLARQAGETHADDLAQVVFLRIARNLETFRHESNLATWIYQIASHAVIDFFRSHTFQQESLQISTEAAGLEEALERSGDLKSPFLSLEKALVRNEMAECIRGMVEDLPDLYREVLVLSEFEELTNREISHKLEISLSTVKMRLHRARQQLRQTMECGCHLYHDRNSGLACEPR